MQWDPGPKGTIAKLFKNAPLSLYKSNPKRFRLEWGPIYYRGRLNGSAKVVAIGQDPAADENVARRILVGSAGQRLQGFLSKIGITRSYVMINSVLYSIYGQFDKKMKDFVDIPEVAQWRNQLLDTLVTPKTKAVLAFGLAARHVVETWPGASSFINQGGVFYLTHPTARPDTAVMTNWSSNLAAIAAKVTPDSGATVDLTPYEGAKFKDEYLVRIPLTDFAFGSPEWIGSGDMAVRATKKTDLSKETAKSMILWRALGDEG